MSVNPPQQKQSLLHQVLKSVYELCDSEIPVHMKVTHYKFASPPAKRVASCDVLAAAAAAWVRRRMKPIRAELSGFPFLKSSTIFTLPFISSKAGFHRLAEQTFNNIKLLGQPAWKILIMDRVTVKVMSKSCKMADITDQGISLVEELFKRREPMPGMDAIYFIQPSKENIVMFLSDMSGREPLYRKAYIFFSSTIPKELVNHIKSDSSVLPRIGALREMNMEYFPIDNQGFLTDHDQALQTLYAENAENSRHFNICLNMMATRIATVFASLKELPFVRYRAAKSTAPRDLVPSKLAAAIWDCISKFKAIPNFPQTETCELLIVDRSVDQAPPSDVQDKISFIINNISLANIESKGKDFAEILPQQYYPWFAQYMVMKRASIEPNFHDLYLKFLDKVDSKLLFKEILQNTYENCKVLLGSELIKSSSEERSLLKNLGSWLGKLTIGRNHVLRAREIDPKSLIVEAYEKGLMIAVIPFTSKVLEPCQNSIAYQPPNPWTMAILGLLAEIYSMPNLKMNLKFDIEEPKTISPLKQIDLPIDVANTDTASKYSKEEEMVVEELQNRNFTYLVNEHPSVDGYKCLFSEEGFDRVELRQGFPPIVLVKRAKVYVHQDMKADDQLHKKWPGC
ncbi:hypothetical protein F2Q69_00063942 [Brassica cretica]|uniref:CCR4-NOT transcription complex subunit 1 CAF1-binding domain-containing protein n=1 Tax=Brassica cretica TaxID=69181 RepID=A0A8S9RC42_BRACR|nr:hypothetical protein F2Q69_00063942 [Brassica cretica]